MLMWTSSHALTCNFALPTAAASPVTGACPVSALYVSRLSWKGPGNLYFRIQPDIFDFEPELGLKRSQTKPKIPGTVPTDRHTTIPNDDFGVLRRRSETFKL